MSTNEQPDRSSHDVPRTQRLGPYRLLRTLGRGGMGTVYAAVEEETGRSAAIKVLSPTLATIENFRDRFGAEIESLRKLRHPNIVQLVGYGEQDGQLFYVMELVDGQSLQDELRRGRRFTWREVTRIAITTCAALKHAHDHGIIHRDLKPGNLLLTTDDKVKLCDFGIAKLFGSTTISTGSVIGTAEYMAPEQGEGKPVGPRTDLYSLGSVMYALLAGRPPFTGKSVAEIVHKVRFETPLPVGRRADDVPVELEHLIEQLLEKDPQKRIPTALAVSHRLKAMEHALSIPSPDAVPRPGAADAHRSVEEPSQLANQITTLLPDQSSTGNSSTDISVTMDEPLGSPESDHFTRVSEQVEAAPTYSVWIGLLRVALAVCVAAAAFVLIRQWMEPPTADELYEAINQKNDRENPRLLLEAERDIEQFMQQYPQDLRVEELQELQEEIELQRLQRRLQAKARRGQSTDSPLEQLYLHATREMDLHPELAAQQLQALIDLYGSTERLTPDQSRCIALARKQLRRLREEIERQQQLHLPLLQEQLNNAIKLESSDPDRARQMYLGIVRLYRDKPWAHDLVRQVRERLSRLADRE